MMEFIITHPPNHCPGCGKPLSWDGLSKDDFYSGATFTCQECGSRFRALRVSQMIHLWHLVDVLVERDISITSVSVYTGGKE